MNKDLYINSFQVILPEHHLSQNQINNWIINSHMRSSASTVDPAYLRKFALSENYIEKRYFECGEVDEAWDDHEIYCIDSDKKDGAPIDVRNRFFARKARKVFEKLYESRKPSHLIHVTCTGYVSPSPAQDFFSNIPEHPTITHAYHMGCYASLPSVRMGMGLSAIHDEDVDIVHTEMCSLHLHSSSHTPEQMVVQTLFADGHIKYTISQNPHGMKIKSVLERLVPDTQDDMTWIPGPHGMQMTLSREVPFRIRDALPEFINDLCVKAGVEKRKVIENAIFAVHPGGPKIIEAVQKKLELTDDQVKHSKKILFERGNMSSATLPHVWNEILDAGPEDGRLIVSLAFGPGLTIFGSLFEVRK